MNKRATTHLFRLTLFMGISTVAALGQSLPGDVTGDGYVDQNDINLIAAAIGTNAIGSSDPRDLNKDGKITIVDARLAALRCSVPGCAVQASVRLDQSASQLTIVQSQPTFLTTYFNYSTGDTANRTITVTQALTQTGTTAAGVAISPALPASYNVSKTVVQSLEQQFTGVTPGTYNLKTTAQLSPSGPIQESIVSITVVPVPTAPALIGLGYSPGAVPIHTNTAVTFTTKAVNFDPANPPVVTLEGVDFKLSVPMTDDGQGADLGAGDGIYSAAVNLAAAPGTCLTLRATAGTVSSTTQTLCATNLPCFPVASDVSNIFTDSSGGRVVKDEIVIGFTLGATESQIEALAASMSAAIVGGLPELHAYQFKLPSVPTNLAALQSIIAAVKTQPIVLSAGPNGVAKPTAVHPNDPLYAGNSTNLIPLIHGDGAWYWGRGGCAGYPNDVIKLALLNLTCPNIVIAIVDEGVGPNPDLGPLLPGYNFVENNTNAAPIPGDDHGEEMTGLAAALLNNRVGNAGVAPGSQILPVKVLESNDGTEVNAAAGISWAAAHGARVINASFSFFTTSLSSPICTAVQNAVNLGVSVIAAAGNSENNCSDIVRCTPVELGIGYSHLPAMCPGAIVVGATNTDATGTYPAFYGNYGNLVSVVAPGGANAMAADGSYQITNGTSNSTAVVSGAVAMMLGKPTSNGVPISLTPAQVKARLTATSNPLTATNPSLPAAFFGGGLLDISEAIYNGSFEAPDLTPWTTAGTVAQVSNLRSTCPGGALCPQDRKRMAYLSIGATGDGTSATLSQDLWSFRDTFDITSTLPTITFKYAFITARPPSARPSPVNESLTATFASTVAAHSKVLATESVNSSALTPLTGITLQGGNGTAYWTGWKTATIPVEPGQYVFNTLKFSLNASGATGGYQTVLLVDQIQFQ